MSSERGVPGGGPPRPILLTGATGYVGGHLLRRLEHERRRVRCLTRQPDALGRRTGHATEVVTGDLLAPDSLVRAMEGVHVAYYLVHSMDAPGRFEELDRRAAINFAGSAREAGVRHIIYLSGLGSSAKLSAHLASRHEVGSILRTSGAVTTELRASIVIGAGSASFETVRAVVEQLPAIPAPKAMRSAAQPIAIEDLIEYLVAALSMPARSAVFEIGGDDQVTYAEVMREYARQRNLRRRVVPLPGRTLHAAPLLLRVLTPQYGRVSGAMANSLRHETVVRDPAAGEAFAIQPRGLSAAIEHALAREDDELAEMPWAELLPPSSPWGGTAVSRRRVSSRVLHVDAAGRDAFAPIQRIGGTNGWYAADWFWRLRGRLDQLRGGNGMRSGRRDPHTLCVGDTVDFWRVERLQAGRRLLLAAEMKLPGRLWLQFDVDATDARTAIRQTTVFDPAGYVGLAYWYLLYPVHDAVFAAMMRGLCRVIQPNALARRRRRPRGPLQKVVDVGKDRAVAVSSLLDPLPNRPPRGALGWTRPSSRSTRS